MKSWSPVAIGTPRVTTSCMQNRYIPGDQNVVGIQTQCLLIGEECDQSHCAPHV